MSYMTARVMPAKYVRAGDYVHAASIVYPSPYLARNDVKRVEHVCFDDYYGVSGIWFRPQTGGSYSLPSPDIEVEPDELIMVYR